MGLRFSRTGRGSERRHWGARGRNGSTGERETGRPRRETVETVQRLRSFRLCDESRGCREETGRDAGRGRSVALDLYLSATGGRVSRPRDAKGIDMGVRSIIPASERGRLTHFWRTKPWCLNYRQVDIHRSATEGREMNVFRYRITPSRRSSPWERGTETPARTGKPSLLHSCDLFRELVK